MATCSILHTNDIHGRIDGLARIATVIEQIRTDEPDNVILYFDLGDSEEYSHRLCSLTKGAATHRLLEKAGCDAVVVGNAMLSRFGPSAVGIDSAAVRYPHLLANIWMPDGKPIPGTKTSTLMEVGGFQLGLIGLSSNMDGYETFFNLQFEDPLACAQREAAQLRQQGAQAVIVLSHLGLVTDRQLAEALAGQVDLILGGHSHSLLADGEMIGQILIAQAGQYAEHLGRVDLTLSDGGISTPQASVIEISEDVPPSPRLLDLIEVIEQELQQFLGQTICTLPQSMDLSIERECQLGNLMADALRWHEKADIGIVVPGVVFTDRLPAGPLTRERLWSRCPSPGNPGLALMRGEHLAEVIQRGLDPELAADRHPALRGAARGLIHLSGAHLRSGQIWVQDHPLKPEMVYRVAAADFEFEPVWGYVDEAWDIQPHYDTSIIMRDVLEAYLADSPDLNLSLGRLG
jgi:2',3'-cyclic-nucleotide 2'-phosphodiesterase (5'-nucleotidase family)